MLAAQNANRPAPALEDIQRLLAMGKAGAMPLQPGMSSAAPFAGMVQSSFRPDDHAPSPTWGMPGHEDAGLPQPSSPFPRSMPDAPGSDLSQMVLAAGPARPLGFGMSGTGQRPQADGQQGQPATGGMFANAKGVQPANRPGNGGAAPTAPDLSIAPPNLLDQDNSLPPPSTDISPFSPDLSRIPTRHPKFFENNGLGETLLKGVGEFALQYSASQGNPAALATLQDRMTQHRQQQLWAREDATHRQDHQWDVESAAAKARLPDYFMSGRDRVAFDPTAGTSKVVYDAPSDAQDYADSLGYTPGTPQYKTAVSDYVLRGNGATAFQNKTNFEGVRQDNRQSLEDIRQGHRVDLHSMPTYTNLHPRPAGNGGGGTPRPPRTMANVYAPIVNKLASGLPLTPAEQGVYNDYRSRGRGGNSGGSGGAPTGGGKVYQNAQGHKIRWNGSAWVPAQ